MQAEACMLANCSVEIPFVTGQIPFHKQIRFFRKTFRTERSGTNLGKVHLPEHMDGRCIALPHVASNRRIAHFPSHFSGIPKE